MKTKVETSKAPLPGKSPHSQAIIANNFIFTQGCIYLTTEGKLLEGTLDEQINQIMKNIEEILKEAGATLNDVVKSTIFVTEMSDYGKVNEIYATYFLEPYPARETVCVKALPLNAKVEISVIALKK